MLKNMRNHKTFIIAEVGINHNGNISIAKKLIDIVNRLGTTISVYHQCTTRALKGV